MPRTDATDGPMDALVQAARDLRPDLLELGPEIEAGRRLPTRAVELMKAAGVFRMTIPRAWGGPEADPMTQVRVVEALSRANGSAGWCAMIGSDGGYLSAGLDQEIARELYQDLDAVSAYVVRPSSTATAVEGGFRVNGRLPFASGCEHSAWLAAGSTLIEDGAPRLSPAGTPMLQVCLLSPEQVTIEDTWYSTGVRGSGSHDLLVHDAFVPRERCFVFGAPPKRDGPLYAYPMMFIANMTGVPLGIARDAIDTLVELSASKVRNLGGGLRDEAFVQSSIARAEARLGSARAYTLDVLAELWDCLQRGDLPDEPLVGRFRLSIVHCFESCAEAVDLMYRAAGGTAVYAKCPLDRHFRDIHTMLGHTVVWPGVYQGVGRIFLGMSPGMPL